MGKQPEPTTIDEYLDELCRSNPMLSSEQAEGLRNELRAHLESIAQFRECIGDSPDDAMKYAIRQFGSPQAIGRLLFRDWKRAQRKRPIPRWLQKTGIYVVYCGISFGIVMPLCATWGVTTHDNYFGLCVYGGVFGVLSSCVKQAMNWQDISYPGALLDLAGPLRQYSPQQLEEAYNKRLDYRANPNDRKNMVEFFERARYPLRCLDMNFFVKRACWFAAVSLLPLGSYHDAAIFLTVNHIVSDMTEAFLKQIKVTRELAR